jgi:hypothetical protein
MRQVGRLRSTAQVVLIFVAIVMSLPWRIRVKLLTKKLALILGCYGVSGVLLATELPPDVQAAAAQANITLNADASFTLNGQKYITLIPPNYSAATPAGASFAALPDNSVTWGGLQFVPVIENPGFMPRLPDNFVPAAKRQLPDFAPRLDSSRLPCPPAGVAVPPL